MLSASEVQSWMIRVKDSPVRPRLQSLCWWRGLRLLRVWVQYSHTVAGELAE
jgi:hypothetical protein